MPELKLGKRPARRDSRTLKLFNYIQKLAPPPDETNNTRGVKDWGMFANNVLGDCTIAGVAHAPMLWATANKTSVPSFTDDLVKEYYSKWDGYVAGDASTDQGGVELDVLNQWRQQGFNGHPLSAYVSANPKNELHLKQGVYLFGVIYAGVELPLTAYDQLNAQQVWRVVEKSDGTDAYGSWGGHALDIVDYVKDGKDTLYAAITWGTIQYMTAEFIEKYFSEAYPLLSDDWLTNNAAPNGFPKDQLLQDLQAVTG